MREFATSETTKIRQKVTVPPIFDAVEFNWSKQLQDPLDPFAVEFMLSFFDVSTESYTCSQVTLNYCSVYCVCCLNGRTFIDNCKPPAKPQHSCPLRPSIIIRKLACEQQTHFPSLLSLRKIALFFLLIFYFYKFLKIFKSKLVSSTLRTVAVKLVYSPTRFV